MITGETGLFAGIPNDAYHRGPGISKSGLDLIARSPAHYRYATDAANDNDGDEDAKAATRWQRIGSLTHKLVLEPESIWDEYAQPFVAPEGAIRTVDDAKAWLTDRGLPTKGKRDDLLNAIRDEDPAALILDDLQARWAEDLRGRAVINTAELELATAMSKAIEAHPLAGPLFLSAPGEAELSGYWRDTATGVLCRFRPDWWRSDGVLVDVKTTEDASPEAFSRSVLQYRYHVQAAWYLEGAARSIDQMPIGQSLPPGVQVPTVFLFVAVEKKPPHAVAVYMLDDDALRLGRDAMRIDLEVYSRCLQSNQWPAYGDRLLPLSLPEWYLRRQLGAV